MTNDEFYAVLKRLSKCLTKQSLTDFERVHDAKILVRGQMEKMEALSRLREKFIEDGILEGSQVYPAGDTQ